MSQRKRINNSSGHSNNHSNWYIGQETEISKLRPLHLGMVKFGAAMALPQKGDTECSGSAITCCVALHRHCHAQSSSFIIFPCNVPFFLTIRCCKWLLIFINCFVVFLVGRLDSCSAVTRDCLPAVLSLISVT